MKEKIMEIEESLNNVLTTLANSLSKPIYIVGGYVRDSILKRECCDVDLCGAMKVEDVENELKNTTFTTKDINTKFGTMKICNDAFVFEYTTFRKEGYEKNGKHCPSKIEFIEDLKIDALRRDFTCNAIYYDIKNKEIVDVFSAISHIENKEIVAISANTFNVDGERILRMLRFAIQLDFGIEKNTFINAIKNQNNLLALSPNRKIKEMTKIELEIKTHPEKLEKLNNLLTVLTKEKK